MKVKDMQEYLGRFKPDDTIEFDVIDDDGDLRIPDVVLEYISTPTIKLEL